MGDPQSEHLLASLSVTFDAALAAEDDVAAWDLAQALRHGAGLRTSLGRAQWALHLRDVALPLTVIGTDYVEGPKVIAPLAAGPLCRTSDATGTVMVDEPLVARLSRLVRTAAHVEVLLRDATCRGVVHGMGADFLEVRDRAQIWALPLAALVAIRLSLSD